MGKAKEGDSFQKKGVSSKTKFPVMNLRIETDDWESLVSLRELFEVRDQERKSNCQGTWTSQAPPRATEGLHASQVIDQVSRSCY